MTKTSKDKKDTKTKAKPELTKSTSHSDSDDVLSESSSDPPAAATTQTKTAHPGLRPSRSLEITLFDRLEKMYGGPRIKRMLNVQYRSVSQSHVLD